MGFRDFFQLACGPRGIAAAVGTKNMPPACFLNAPTVLQEIIGCYALSKKTTFGGLLFVCQADFVSACREAFPLRFAYTDASLDVEIAI